MLLGKVLELSQFPDRRSLHRRLLWLSILDWHITKTSLSKYITTLTRNGFIRYWYSITDDSKHLKFDRHAVMISAKTQENEAPSFKLLTISTAASKDSKGNRELNKEIIEARLSPETIKHYGGNVTDHTSDAQK